MYKNKNIVAIIPARGGSKGIPNKNITNICGYPLISWSIRQALSSALIQSVWVTSDDSKILNVAKSYGSEIITRPEELSCDISSSESAWIHAIDEITSRSGSPDLVVGMQATSPIRDPEDLDKAIETLIENQYDSLLSTVEVEDRFTWNLENDLSLTSLNYDYKDRKPRQKLSKTYLENGSFYIFSPLLIKKHNNRLSGRIGMHVMDKHKAFQIDNFEDIKLCSAIMSAYGLDH